MSGDHVDLTSDLTSPSSGQPAGDPAGGAARRPFLGIHFACCGVYARIFRNAEQTAYAGNCPCCMRPVQVKIASGGSGQRFFTAY